MPTFTITNRRKNTTYGQKTNSIDTVGITTHEKHTFFTNKNIELQTNCWYTLQNDHHRDINICKDKEEKH